MNAGGVGAVGGGMAGAGMVAAPMSAPAAASAGVGASQLTGVQSGAPLGGGMPANISNLAHALQGFSSAEILMALMLLGGDQDGKKKSPDLAMAMLAGMALGGQIGGASAQGSCSVPGVGAAGMGGMGGVGLQINLQA